MYGLEPATILEYTPEGLIVTKTRFVKNEKGIFGTFNETWTDRGWCEQKLIIFAPDREEHFDAPQDMYQEIISHPNHRFHKHLLENIPPKRETTQEEREKYETNWRKLEHSYCGGFSGNYVFANKTLHLTPEWRGESRGTSAFNELSARLLAQKLIEREDFTLEKFKIKKGLQKLIY